MKLWILGREGMLGSTFCALCERKKISYLASSKREGDITSLSPRKEAFTHIINCAAYTNVDGAEEEEEAALSLNVQGVKNLARIAEDRKAKLVHFSTDYVFDGEETSPYKEEASCNPLSVYGRTKWEGELALQRLMSDALVIRTSWLYGRGENHLVAKILKLMREKEQISIVSDQRAKPTYVEDLASATLELLSQRGLFHFANGGDCSPFELAVEIFTRAKEPLRCRKIVPLPFSEFRAAAKRPLYSVLCTKKAAKVLSASPRHWKEALALYLGKSYD